MAGSPMSIGIESNGNIVVSGTYLAIKYSNAGDVLWSNPQGPLGDAGRQSLAIDASGNVLVTGIHNGDVTGDGYETIKYSGGGVPLWTNLYEGGTPGSDWPCGLAVDTKGNVFVTGFSDHEGSMVDFLTLAYSPDGLPLWTNRYDLLHKNDWAAGIRLDKDGNVFITGTSQALGSLRRFVTIKYSNAGVPMWTNLFSYGRESGCAKAIAIDNSDNVIVTGYSYDAKTKWDTIKYSNAGEPIWTNRYCWSGSFDMPSTLGTDKDGNVFVTGISSDGSNGLYYVTLAYSSAGAPLWTNLFLSGSPTDSPAALVVDRLGDVIVTGPCQDRTNYHDFLTIKYSSLGVVQWTNRFGDDIGLTDKGAAVAVDDSGNVFVTGLSRPTYAEAEPYDYVTIKYSAAPPQPPTLVSKKLSGQLILNWANAQFKLEAASDAAGPFAPVTNATSPFTNDFAGSQRFFRLRAD